MRVASGPDPPGSSRCVFKRRKRRFLAYAFPPCSPHPRRLAVPTRHGFVRAACHPIPAPPGAGCPQLRSPAATEPRCRSLTSTRSTSASRRTGDVTHYAGRCGGTLVEVDGVFSVTSWGAGSQLGQTVDFVQHVCHLAGHAETVPCKVGGDRPAGALPVGGESLLIASANDAASAVGSLVSGTSVPTSEVTKSRGPPESAPMTGVPQAMHSTVKGHWFLPRGGRETCPVTVTRSARWWPWDLPSCWPPPARCSAQRAHPLTG